MSGFFLGYHLSYPSANERSHDRLDYITDGISTTIATLYRSHSLYATSYTKMMNHKLFRETYGTQFDEYPYSVDLLRKNREEPFFQDLVRFYVCLRIWQDLSNNPFSTIEEIWYKSLTLGPEYTTYLDDLYAYSYRSAYGIDYILPKEQEIYPVQGYSDIFPARFLPRWEEETNDIAEYALNDVDIDENTRDEVLFELEHMIYSAKQIEIIDPEELAFNVKDSTTYIDGIKKRPYDLSWDEATRISTSYIGYEEKILVYPSGMRDTVILEKGSSNMIRWAEAQLGEIMYHQKESIYARGRDRLRDFIKIFRDNEGIHVLRDIKKCGLTVPIQQLLPYIITILKKYHPSINWDYLNIYKEPQVRLKDGTWVTLERGVGLGMSNALTTLLCIAAHRVAMKRFYKELGFKIRSVAAIGNDDSDIWIDSLNPDHGQLLLTFELDVLTELGFHCNQKKSYISYHFHLFEEYGAEGFRIKLALAAGMLTSAVLERNLRRAKEFARAAYDFCPSVRVTDIIYCIAEHRPHEFYPQEKWATFSLGGWIPDYVSAEDTNIERSESILKVPPEKAWYAYRVIREWEKASLSIPDSPICTASDNSCRMYRALRYTGLPVRGPKYYYTYSLYDRYKSIIKVGKTKGTQSYYKKIYNLARLKVRKESISREKLYLRLIKDGRMSYMHAYASKKIIPGNIAYPEICDVPLLQASFPPAYYAPFNDVVARILEDQPKIDKDVWEECKLRMTRPLVRTIYDPTGRQYGFSTFEPVLLPNERRDKDDLNEYEDIQEIINDIEELIKKYLPISCIPDDVYPPEEVYSESEESDADESTWDSDRIEAYYELIGLGKKQEADAIEAIAKEKSEFINPFAAQTTKSSSKRTEHGTMPIFEWRAWIDARSDAELMQDLGKLSMLCSDIQNIRGIGKYDILPIEEINRMVSRLKNLHSWELEDAYPDLLGDDTEHSDIEFAWNEEDYSSSSSDPDEEEQYSETCWDYSSLDSELSC